MPKTTRSIQSGKKSRDLERTRHEILGVAFTEVFTKGFQGVSVDDIVKKTSLTKGAFYHHFPTKLSLGYALVDEVIGPMTLDRWISPLEQYENPLEGILKQMRLLIGKADPAELRWGCPLNNLVQEMAPVDEGFRVRLQKCLQLWINGIELQLRRAKKSGYLKDTANTKQMAYFIVMAHEGMYGILKGLDSPQAFKPLYASVESYLRSQSLN